ncbi:MAG: hypothetical protein ABJG55_22165 [Paracoccaceae bacterium]
MLRIFAASFLLLSVQIGAAQGFPEFQVRVRVAALDATTFEVIDGVNSGPRQMWCAAALFAKRKYGVNTGQIWLERGLGPSSAEPRRRSIVFSLKPVPNEYKSISLSIRRPGQVVGFALASSLCRNSDFRIRIREVG